MELLEKKQAIVDALIEKKGADITVLDVRHLTVIADYFIIAGARSAPQVKALARNTDEKLSALGEEPLRKEGMTDGRWAVLDYGNIIVHVFNDETRVLYALEQLWGDGQNAEKISAE